MSTFGCILLIDYLLKYSREIRQKCFFFFFLGVGPAIKSSQNPKKQFFLFFIFYVAVAKCNQTESTQNTNP